MTDKWDNAPVQERALRLSMQSLQAVEGESLHELENPIDYLESVALVLHELKRVMKPRPLCEWHEEMGDVLWWRFPIEEPPYLGNPLDVGKTIRVVIDGTSDGPSGDTHQVGGWPGYHTHFTPLPQVREP